MKANNMYRFLLILSFLLPGPSQASMFSLQSRLFSVNKIGLAPYSNLDDKSLGLMQIRLHPSLSLPFNNTFSMKFTPQWTADGWLYGSSAKSKPHQLRNDKWLIHEFSLSMHNNLGRLVVGQIPLIFGSQSLLGDGYYHNLSRSFTGIHYSLPFGFHSLQLFYSESSDETRLSRLRSGYEPLLGGVYFEGRPNYLEEIDFFIFSLESNDTNSSNNSFQSLSAGSRLLLDKRTWAFSLEAIHQGNEELTKSTSETFLSMRFDYKFISGLKSQIGISLDIASKYFHPYYQNSFIRYGEMKNFSASNLSDLSIAYKLDLSEKLRLRSAFHHFERTSSDSGDPIFSGEYTSAIQPGALGLEQSHVGDEFNISIERNWQNLTLESGIGIFEPGSYFKTEKGTTTSSSLWAALNWSL